LHLLVVGISAVGCLAHAQSGLDIELSQGRYQNLAAEAGSQIGLKWAVVNHGKSQSGARGIAVFLSKSGDKASVSATRSWGTPWPGRRTGYGWWSKDKEAKQTQVGGLSVYQGDVPPLASGGTELFDIQLDLPRGIAPGTWYLHLFLQPSSDSSTAKEPSSTVVPIEISVWNAADLVLDFEGIAEGAIPPNQYSADGVTLQNLSAVTAIDLGGTGNFCSTHNGSASAGYVPGLTASGGARSIINIDDGFSDVSMSYAQSDETQGGFHIWSGPNGTGTVAYTFFFTPDAVNGAQTACSYSVWRNTGTLEYSGQSIEFFENDNVVDKSWFIVDNVSFTTNRNEIVLHDGSVMPREGESGGFTFGVSLSKAIPSGQSITLKLERVSPAGSGENLAVLGGDSVTFTSSSWNTPKPLSIWAPENDNDTNNQVREFRLYRSGGSSSQVVPDRALNVEEIDDDFHLTVGVLQGANQGSVNPEFTEMAFDFNDDDWASLEFTATPFNGYRFSEWSVSFSGVDNDILFQLGGTAQTPTQIQQLELDSGGSTSIGIFAAFEEIGPVTVTMSHQGLGITRINGQIIGHQQSIQIQPGLSVALQATPGNGWAFGGWTSTPSGVVQNPGSANTNINTTVNATVTAQFVAAPANLTVYHNGNGSTSVNGQTVAAGGTVSIPTGQSVPIHAEPDPEWQFSGWSTDPSGLVVDPSSPDSSLVSQGNASLTANFQFMGLPFTIQASANGTVDPIGTQYLEPGDHVTVEVFPENGYKFVEWDIETGEPEILNFAGQPHRFLITVFQPTVVTAVFAEKLPTSLLVRATNLQMAVNDPNNLENFDPDSPINPVLLREPEDMVQVLSFLKEQGMEPNTHKLEFFNEGDEPLIIETVTMQNRFGQVPSLAFSGFCLMQNKDFDPLDCATEQPLSNQPLPPPDAENPPTLYLDFGREPGFPDVPEPDEDHYGGAFAYFTDQLETVLVFDFKGSVYGSADVADIELEKIQPVPVVAIPNGGVLALDPIPGGHIIPMTFKITNSDISNPFFADIEIQNSNDGEGIDPQDYGFFKVSDESLIVPPGGESFFGLKIETKGVDGMEPPVTYAAEVKLGTGDNLFEFDISVLVDGTSVIVTAFFEENGMLKTSDILVNEVYRLKPDAPTNGSIYEFSVRNPSSQDSVFISNLMLSDKEGSEGAYRLEIDQNELPGNLNPNQTKDFNIRLSAPAREEIYSTVVSFEYATPTQTRTFEFIVDGKVSQEDLSAEDEAQLANFDRIQLAPSLSGETVAYNLTIRHGGSAGRPPLVGHIDEEIGTGFSVINPAFSLQPGESHPFEIAFTGPAPGEYEGVIRVHSNDPVVDPFVINIVGSVLEPGSPPGLVPNFTAQIDGQPLGGLPVYNDHPHLYFSWDDAPTLSTIDLYHVIIKPDGGPWLYGVNYQYPATAGGIATENLELGTTYSIHIRAKDINGLWGNFVSGGDFTITDPGPPSAVPGFEGRINDQLIDGLTVEETDPGILFSWDYPDTNIEIQNYQLVVQPLGGPWLYAPTVPHPASAHFIQTANLEPATTYSTHIRAKDTANTWGPFVNGGSFTVEETPPPSLVPDFVGRIDGQIVDGLTVHITDPVVDFSWNHATSPVGISKYQLVLQPTSGGGFLYSPVVDYPATSHPIHTANLEYGKSYSIHIRARDTEGVWGPYHPGHVFHVVKPVPSTVPNFQGFYSGQNLNGLAVPISNPALNFTWNHVNDPSGIDLYHIVVKPSDSGTWLYGVNASYPDTSLNLQTSNLVPGQSYDIQIRALNQAGNWGPFVSGGTFTVIDPVPPKVTSFQGFYSGQNLNGLAVPITNPTLNFTWNHVNDPSGIDLYHIVVKPSDSGNWLYGVNAAYPDTSLNLQTSNLEVGRSYNVQIRALNQVGNWGQFHVGGTFIVVDPVPPQVTSFNGYYNGQNLVGLTVPTTSPTLNFTWSHVNDPSGIDLYHIVVKPSDSGNWLYGVNAHYPDTSLTLQTSNLEVGRSYDILIRALNHAGNWGQFFNRGSFTIQ